MGSERALNQERGERGSKFSWVPGSVASWMTLRSLKSPTHFSFFSHDNEEVRETTSVSPLRLRIYFFPYGLTRMFLGVMYTHSSASTSSGACEGAVILVKSIMATWPKVYCLGLRQLCLSSGQSAAPQEYALAWAKYLR